VDREAIERNDFPTGRRGYDPATVDAHLRRVADELEAVRASGRRPATPPPLSSGASEQVRAILEAAERSATDMREQAGEEAAGHVARVRGAADGMLSRLDELESQLAGLLAALRRGGERLNEGLAALQAQVAEFAPDAEPIESDPPSPAPEAPEPLAAAPEPPASAPEPLAPASEPLEPAPGPPESAPDRPALATPPADEAGARLIALNMALGGTPREETARYLAEHFALADPDGLLDDVYSGAGQ
jgi:DivIVA domain-containing protein